jgi:hypothetical protein
MLTFRGKGGRIGSHEINELDKIGNKKTGKFQHLILFNIITVYSLYNIRNRKRDE